MDIGEKISLYRKEKKITIDELVEQSGVPKGTINKIIAGTTKAPTLDNIKAIARALGKRLDDFDDSPNDDLKFTAAEQQHIKKYRTLDAHGKRMVDFVLDEEAARVEADTAPPKMYHIKIAGFDGSFEEKDITEEEADAIRNLPEFTEKI